MQPVARQQDSKEHCRLRAMLVLSRLVRTGPVYALSSTSSLVGSSATCCTAKYWPSLLHSNLHSHVVGHQTPSMCKQQSSQESGRAAVGCQGTQIKN